MLILIPSGRELHPAARPAFWMLLLVLLAIFHPESKAATGIPQALIYIAIVAPLFWTSRLLIDVSNLRRILIMFWTFHAASSGIGVLQVYYPGQFRPALSAEIANPDVYAITNAKGERALRPSGLTDIPGSAAMSGLYAAFWEPVCCFRRDLQHRKSCISPVSSWAGQSSIYRK